MPAACQRTALSICENLRNLRINQGQKSASRRRYNNHTTLPIATGKSPSISADYADFHRLRPTCSARVPVARSRCRKRRRPSSASSPVSSAARVIAGPLPKRTASSICENLRNLRINQGQKSASRRRYNNHTTLPIATGKSPSISADYADFHRLRPTLFSAGAGCFVLVAGSLRRPSSASSPVSSAARVIAGQLPKRTASSICVICG
jgi:hypothetical protein